MMTVVLTVLLTPLFLLLVGLAFESRVRRPRRQPVRQAHPAAEARAGAGEPAHPGSAARRVDILG